MEPREQMPPLPDFPQMNGVYVRRVDAEGSSGGGVQIIDPATGARIELLAGAGEEDTSRLFELIRPEFLSLLLKLLERGNA